MIRPRIAVIVLSTAALLGGVSEGSFAREAAPLISEADADGASTLDPALRALMVGIAASMLREAAASPDPMNTLGSTLQQNLASVLRSPDAVRLIESLVAQAFKDAPAELREPLELFASSMLKNMRRELTDGVTIR
jgi:hypothetical protein